VWTTVGMINVIYTSTFRATYPQNRPRDSQQPPQRRSAGCELALKRPAYDSRIAVSSRGEKANALIALRRASRTPLLELRLGTPRPAGKPI